MAPFTLNQTGRHELFVVVPHRCYVFSQTAATLQAVQDRISAGATGLNDCNMHVANSELPFGGVGDSGIGTYTGSAARTSAKRRVSP